MNTQTLNPVQDQISKAKALVIEFSKDPDIIQVVKDIESRYATTQDHYGDYISFLTPYKGTALYIISEALVMAGASRAGVVWAVRILRGE